MALAKTVRPSEACHVLSAVLILVAFCSCLPSCFDMPGNEEAPSPAPYAAADGLVHGTVVGRGESGKQAKALSAIAVTTPEVGDKAHRGKKQSEGQEKGSGCQEHLNEEVAPEMWRVTPFLIALVAGGVLNLEVFEGFPML